MPNIAAVLKDEIRRLARKEVKTYTGDHETGRGPVPTGYRQAQAAGAGATEETRVLRRQAQKRGDQRGRRRRAAGGRPLFGPIGAGATETPGVVGRRLWPAGRRIGTDDLQLGAWQSPAAQGPAWRALVAVRGIGRAGQEPLREVTGLRNRKRRGTGARVKGSWRRKCVGSRVNCSSSPPNGPPCRGLRRSVRGGERAAKDGRLLHAHPADQEVGVLLEELSQLGDARPAAADPADRQMGLKAAVLFAVAEFGQGVLDAVVQDDHLLCSRAGAEPHGARPGGVGKRPGAADLQLERLHLGRPARHGLAHLGDLALVDVAEELQRQVQVVRLDPFHVGRRAASAAISSPARARTGPRDFNGDEGAEGFFHRGQGSGAGTRG